MVDKHLWLSPEGFQKIARPDGKYLYWCTDINDELPIFVSNSGPGSIPPSTFNKAFDEVLKTAGNLEALRYKVDGQWKVWTFQEYYNDAKKFASSMVALGINTKKTINIIGFNSPQWVIGFAGALLAGCIPVGVYTTNKVEACEYIASHSEAELILVQNEVHLKKYLKIWHNLPNIKAIVVYWPGKELESLRIGKSIFTWDEFLSRNKPENFEAVDIRLARIRPSQCASIVYTSGTTGPPKGVLLSHDNCTWIPRIMGSLATNPETNQERIVSYLPLSHVAALQIDIFVALCAKYFVTFADENALQGTLEVTLKETRPTLFFGVPRVLEKFEEKIRAAEKKRIGVRKSVADWAKRIGYEASLNQIANQSTSFSYSIASKLIFNKVREELGLDKCNRVVVGAAPTSKATFDFFLNYNIILFNGYGMSESTSPQSSNSLLKFKHSSVGAPLPGVLVVIKDNKNNILPPGVKGEVCSKGRNKFMGYYKNEKSTKETIDSDGFIHSGDEGMIDNEGFLFITGRFKELIITAGGENIPPVLIEDSIKEKMNFISNAFLLGDGKKHLAVLLSLKTLPKPDGFFSNDLNPEVINFAKTLGIEAKTNEDLINNQEFNKYVKNAIDEINKHSTSRAQEIKKFRFITSDFSIPGGELTPTMKVKRKTVEEKYLEVINEIYRDPKL